MLLWTDHVTEAHYPLFETLKQEGFDGVEIPLGDGDVAHYTALGNQLKQMGMEATCVTSLLEETNIASPDPNIRQAESREFRLNWDKAASRLDWRPVYDWRLALDEIVSWFKAYEAAGTNVAEITRTHLQAFVDCASLQNLPWTE